MEKLKEAERFNGPALEQLFARTDAEWRQHAIRSLSAAVSCPSGLEILYPPIASRQLFFQEALCLKWKARRNGP